MTLAFAQVELMKQAEDMFFFDHYRNRLQLKDWGKLHEPGLRTPSEPTKIYSAYVCLIVIDYGA